jgi:hypothetical protein
MTQRPVLFRNTQWILNTILKKSFYAILGYSKLMDHNDLVSLNNKRSSVVQRVVLMRQVRPYLLLNFF